MAVTATPASARATSERRTGRDVDPRSGQPSRKALSAPWLLGAAALVLYLATLTHGIAWDDNAELAAGVAQLGVVHPTGYPPYMLLGHVFTLVDPFGSPATSANTWSGICAAAAVVVASRYVLVRGGSVIGAGVTALLVTVAPVLWYQATVASAYPFFMLSIALLITAGDAWVRRPTSRRLALLAAAIGLVLVSHKMGVFFAAGGAALIALNHEKLDRRSALPLLALLIPLATMAYIPLRKNWGGWPNLIGSDGIHGRKTLYHWITGTAENVSEANTLGANKYAARIHSERFVVMMLASLSPAAIVLVPAGLRSVWRGRDHSFLLCGVLPSIVASLVVLSTPGAFAYRHVGILLVGAIACGIGVDRLRGRALPAAAVGLLLLVPVASGVYYLQRSHRPAQTWARATLAAVPRHGTILAFWSASSPLRGVQALDDYRTDVQVVDAGPRPWESGEWARHPRALAVGVVEHRTQRVPGAVQVVPSAGLNVKGLSGLSIGPFRVGYPLAWARTFRRVER
jgi:hypothetical protein